MEEPGTDFSRNVSNMYCVQEKAAACLEESMDFFLTERRIVCAPFCQKADPTPPQKKAAATGCTEQVALEIGACGGP